MMNKLIVAIYWYQKNSEIWYMTVDNTGSYFNEPVCFNVDSNITLISQFIAKIFKDINTLQMEKNVVTVKYKTITTVAYGIHKSLLEPNIESKEVDKQIKNALLHYHFKEGKSCHKKKEIKTNQRKILQLILAPLLPKLKAREIDLWAIAFHEDSFKNLAKKIWIIVKNAIEEPLKRGDLKTKFEADYSQLSKNHPPKKKASRSK